MSIIFTEEELTKIENKLGTEFTQLYDKIWNERISVRQYWETCKKNHQNTTGFTKQYWMYKLTEVEKVLDNQSTWLVKVIIPIKEKISEPLWVRLSEYIERNKPVLTLISKGESVEE